MENQIIQEDETKNDQLTEKIYKISRIIIAIMTFVIFNIIFLGEDISWLKVSIIPTLIAYGISFPSSIISKKMLNIGDKMKRKGEKILYYIIVLPIVIFLTFIALVHLAALISNTTLKSTNLDLTWNLVAFVLFIYTVVILGFIVPYAQTIIVLILKKIIKK